MLDTQTATVNGNGIYTTPAGFVPSAVGTYLWSAAYSGDSNNNPVSAPGLSTTAFAGSNGLFPQVGVTLDSAGNVYGTTLGGGANNVGTIFELAKGSSTITVLASSTVLMERLPLLPSSWTPPATSTAARRSEALSATAPFFELAKGSSTITVLASFNSIDGASPSGPLVMDADGNLYGTTKLLGANGVGTIWEVPSGSNTITVLASMIGTDGQPEAIGGLVMDGDDNLYGTAVDGGTDSEGSLFELAKGSNTISVLASFNGSNGIGPFGD